MEFQLFNAVGLLTSVDYKWSRNVKRRERSAPGAYVNSVSFKVKHSLTLHYAYIYFKLKPMLAKVLLL